MTSRSALFCLALSLAGCSLAAKPGLVRQYSLAPAMPPAAAAPDAEAWALVGLHPAEAAGHLRSGRLAVRHGPVEVELDEANRWTEPPADTLGRLLAQALSARPKVEAVFALPDRHGRTPDFSLTLRLEQLEGTDDGRAIARARWSVYSDGLDKVVRDTDKTVSLGGWDGRDRARLAELLADAAGQLAQAIAEDVASCIQQEGAEP